MAIKARTPAAGTHPLADLLFSPSAVFIWDGDRDAVAWMNGAARAKYQRTVAELTASLSKATRTKLAVFSAQPAAQGKPLKLSLKVAKFSPADCLIEPLKIAGGHRGLIVAEAEAQTRQGAKAEPRAEASSTKTVPNVSRKSGAGQASKNDAPSYCNAPAPELTPEELRSFRAIGRKVRKLCRERLRKGEVSTGPGPSPPLAEGAQKPLERPGPGAYALLSAILPSFDLFLILDRSFRVLKVEGHSQRLGWRKSALRGMAVADLLPSSERRNLDRMASKAASTQQTSREHLLAQTSAGAFVPCRAVLGPWPFERAAFFLALISLNLTPRLKRLDLHSESRLQPASLAA